MFLIWALSYNFLICLTLGPIFLSILFSIILIKSNNPILSIFSYVLIVFFLIILLLMARIEFLSYVFCMVYIGAVSILFIFVIMMLNLKKEKEIRRSFSIKQDSLYLLSLSIYALLLKWVWNSLFYFDSIFYYQNMGINFFFNDFFFFSNDVFIFGILLYTDYLFCFLLISVVLLISMVGALILAINKNIDNK